MADSDTTTGSAAGAGRRLLARYIDLNFAAMVIVLPLTLLVALGPALVASPLMFSLVIATACYVVVAAQQALLGNSAGKYVLGIKAIPTGGRQSDFAFFVEREFRVLILGQAFGLQLASMVAGFVSLYYLRKHGETHYDRNFSTVVRYSDDARRLFWLIPMFALVVLAFALLLSALPQRG
ncbi:RDD family protein [Pararhizobium sp. BT-229]|uniref:RDD family protein n=1 Tax=Pararhizobium sp. BT-229 TaxID=2986923 RepID=UPI0021F6CE7E|nr:RDD family protein [Pararhizobium sp. BT-229]MCV9964526.1 RDD family protein [Pararhizobium sp. BT-229]